LATTSGSEPGGPYSPSNSYTFEFGSQSWFGMAMCATQSYPEQTQQCKPDSDRNIVDPATDPERVPGSAFFELQFYPPGWATGCDATRWRAGLHIDSWSQNAINGDALNNTCQAEILGGIENINAAFITLDGKPLGPPDPLHWDPATSGNPVNPDTLFLGQGDHVVVTISDTPSGVQAVVQDTTTGQTGTMVASAANGFGQVQFAPHGTSCTVLPYDFHPMYSTSRPQTRILWAAHSTNVTFTDELGHFDFCAQITAEAGNCDGLEGVPGFDGPSSATSCPITPAGAGLRLRRRLDPHEIVDDGEVRNICRKERHAVDVGGRRDHEIHRSAARLSAALNHRGGKAPPLPCDRGIDGQRIEGRLDHAESLRSQGPFGGGVGDEHTEVKLGQRGGADRRLDALGNPGADQHRRVQ
jgi:hypothetical protein